MTFFMKFLVSKWILSKFTHSVMTVLRMIEESQILKVSLLNPKDQLKEPKVVVDSPLLKNLVVIASKKLLMKTISKIIK